MATTEESVESEPAQESPRPEIKLEPKLGPAWALAPIHLLVLAVFLLIFLTLNYMPLRGTDLWGHVAWGDWIMRHGTLPPYDPFQPLAEGMRVVDSAWLSQMAFAGVERIAGGEGLSTLFALTTVGTYLVLARCFWNQSRRIPVMMIGVGITVLVGLSRLATIRPEIFGVLGFAILLWLFARREGAPPTTGRETAELDEDSRSTNARGRNWGLWIGVPLVMLVWANLHGSFVCGLALLGCMFAGRLMETLWQTRSFSRTLGDADVRERLWVMELGIAATFINPYGIDLHLYTLLFANNENLKDILEWRPLVILDTAGREFALSWVALVLVLRHSRQSVRVSDALLLGLFTLAAVTGIRMMSWYALSFAYFITPHLAELWNRLVPTRWRDWESPLVMDDEPREQFGFRTGRTWHYSLVGMLVCWIAVALAPAGRPIVGDSSRPNELLLDDATPYKLTAWLRENPPSGQLFNPQWWGDWLVWDGPAGVQPFVTTNLHLAPRQVWRDHQSLTRGYSGWQRTMDRYNVQTMIVDKKNQSQLARSARRSADWRIAYEDDAALVLVRRTGAAASASPESKSDEGEEAEAEVEAAAARTDFPAESSRESAEFAFPENRESSDEA